MPTLVASYPVDTGGSDNTDTLVSASFTPDNGEILVVKMATWDTSSTMNAPTATALVGTAPTFTSQVVYNPGSSKPWMAIYTAEVSGSPVGVQVSATHSATPSMHSMVVERWGSASLGTPVASGQAIGDGQPLATLTTTGANSVITAVDADWHGNTGARTYRGSGVEVHAYQQSGSTCHYYWYQDVAVTGSTDFGMTAPIGQSYALAGIELLAVETGTEQNLGLASGTDTAHRLGRSLGRAGDSGTNYGLGLAKAKPLGVGGSSSQVYALGSTKSTQLGHVAETGTVYSPGSAQSKTLGTELGTDTANSVGRAKSQQLGVVAGIGNALNPSKTQAVTLGLATSTDAALPLDTGTPTFGVIGGVDTALALSRVKQAGIGSVAEIGLVNALGLGLSVGLISEIGNAGLLTSAKAKALGLVSESSVAHAVNSGQPTFQEIGSVSETSVCLELGSLVITGGPLTDSVPLLAGRGNRYR